MNPVEVVFVLEWITLRYIVMNCGEVVYHTPWWYHAIIIGLLLALLSGLI